MMRKLQNHFFIVGFILTFLPQTIYGQCLSGDCENGTGKYKCDCGYVFEGTFKNGEKVYGTLTKKNLTYVGEFQNDVAHGKGKITYKDGSWYEGYFENNKYSGLGLYTYKSGTYFHGYFKEDLANGYGVMHYNKGGLYAGFMQADLLSGIGSMKYYNKLDVVESTHFGQFNGDYLNGIGVIKENHGFKYGWALNGNIKEIYISVDSNSQTVVVSDFAQPTREIKFDISKNLSRKAGTFSTYFTNVVGDSINLSGSITEGIFQLSWSQNGEDFVYTYDANQDIVVKWVSSDSENPVAVDINGAIYSVDPKALQNKKVVITNTNFNPNDYP